MSFEAMFKKSIYFLLLCFMMSHLAGLTCSAASRHRYPVQYRHPFIVELKTQNRSQFKTTTRKSLLKKALFKPRTPDNDSNPLNPLKPDSASSRLQPSIKPLSVYHYPSIPHQETSCQMDHDIQIMPTYYEDSDDNPWGYHCLLSTLIAINSGLPVIERSIGMMAKASAALLYQVGVYTKNQFMTQQKKIASIQQQKKPTIKKGMLDPKYRKKHDHTKH